jgi:hypothetical protein
MTGSVQANHIRQMLEHYDDPDMCMGDEFTFLVHVDTETLWKIKGVLSVLSEAVDRDIDYRKVMDQQQEQDDGEEYTRND